MTPSPMGVDGNLVIVPGRCHCGTVNFEVTTPPVVSVEACNCSMCHKTAFLHLIVPAACLRITTGVDALHTYTFNTGVARHTFCRHCGVKPFYVPRSNPDGYSVNLRCIERARLRSVTVSDFDGCNWEQNAGRLRDKSALPAS